MSAGATYLTHLESLLHALQAGQMDKITEAARRIADAVNGGSIIHAFGTGHSHMLAEELFYRAGGLASVNPILHEGLMLHADAVQSTALERLEGLASIIFERQVAKAGDVMIIASNSGRNTVTIEMALLAKQHGLCVIAITSLAHAKASNSRHKSGKRLHEIADIVIDNLGCIGDASIEISRFDRRVAPTSTVIGAAIVNAIVAETVERILLDGSMPEVFASSNTDGGDGINHKLINKYKGVVRSL